MKYKLGDVVAYTLKDGFLPYGYKFEIVESLNEDEYKVKLISSVESYYTGYTYYEAGHIITLFEDSFETKESAAEFLREQKYRRFFLIEE